MVKLGILINGGGSNLQAIIDAVGGGEIPDAEEMIGALLETIHQRGGDYRVFDGTGAEAFKATSDEGHRRLIEAMRARDPEGARAVMVDHIRNTRYRLESMYGVSSEESPQ